MLALSASHFDLCSGSEGHKTQALSHRTTAIARINKALNSPAMSGTRGDALYAALMVLAFQSSYMSDGMLEIYPMIRGCMMMLKSASVNLSLFRQFTVQDHEEQVRTILQSEPLSDYGSPPLKLLLESLRAIRPLCQTKLEIDYFGIVENIIAMSTYSQAFCMLIFLFDTPLFLPSNSLIMGQRFSRHTKCLVSQRKKSLMLL
jgi:hypothetical protein